jgi:trehalose/maltose hydrolase-like predicted phosphorylase/hydroxymethylpyrimidine pyrophosphatase-like HAD family hydrolase
MKDTNEVGVQSASSSSTRSALETDPQGIATPGSRSRSAALNSTAAAVVFDWDGTAVAERGRAADQVRRRVEQLCAKGVHVAVVSGTHVGNVDGQLAARPEGPGTLLLALNRGSELYQVTQNGPVLVHRQDEDPETTAQLDEAAAHAAAVLNERGLDVQVVDKRLNRRKIDLIPGPEWHDPPKSKFSELERAVSARLRRHGIGSIADVARIASGEARRCGLDDPRVTSDAKHVEIGVTDKSDSMRAVLAQLDDLGVGPGLVLLVGDEFGDVGGVPGSDSRMLLPDAPTMTVVSVGNEPGGVPVGVRHLQGGPRVFLALLDEQLLRARHLRVPTVDADARWILRESGSDPFRHRVTETLFTIASGGVATRGSVEETDPLGHALVLASGVYRGDLPVDGLLAGPIWTGLDLAPEPAEDVRVLDMRTGILYREEIAEGGHPMRSMRFASLTKPGVMAMRVEAEAGRLQPTPALELPGPEDAAAAPVRSGRWAATLGRSGGGIAALSSETHGRDANVQTLQRLVATVAEPRVAPRRADAAHRLSAALGAGFERLLAEHRAAWAHRWRAVDVSIPDDPEAELAFRFVLFQLWSLTGASPELAVGARGLSGAAYSGHVFWDADVFLLPAMMTIDPSAASAMVRYRLNRMPQALERARSCGRAGARFPWESALTGDDVTPTSGFLGGREVPILTGELEEHITADVAWAVVRRATWCNEAGTLAADERRLLVETARYWESRATAGLDGRLHIVGVIGPDEYHERVDDNAFTNVMARWNLREACRRAGSDAQPDERAAWDQVAASLVDGYDPETGRHEQFAGYYDLETLLVRDLAPPPVAADILAGRDRIAHSQVIKQPDVLMLHHLVPGEVAPGSLVADLDFYHPRTAHGSSLSPAVAALVLARGGRPDEALELLRVALNLDLEDRGGTTASGLHVGAAGGAWQALLFGVLGVDVRDGVLHLDPKLPAKWHRVDVRFRCLGSDVRVSARSAYMTVSSSRPMSVCRSAGAVVRVDGGHQERVLERGSR